MNRMHYFMRRLYDYSTTETSSEKLTVEDIYL